MNTRTWTGRLRALPRWRWLWLALPAGMALLLYGRALSLPFYLDSPWIVTWTGKHSWLYLWTQPGVSGTFRPISYSIWKLFVTLQGNYAPFPLTFFTLVLHIVNALLAGELAAMWWPRRRATAAITATVMMIATPFAYRSSTFTGCIFHPLVAIYASVMALAYDRWRRGEGRRWAALTALAVVMGPLTHELGYLLLPLLVLVELRGRAADRPAGTYTGLPYWLVGPALAVALIFFYRLSLPETLVQPFERDISPLLDVFLNTSFLLEAITYPTAWIAGLLMRLGLNEIISLWAVALPTLLVLYALLRRGGLRATLTALAWPFVAASPLLLLWPFYGLVSAPRQFIFASVGGALIWAGALAHLPRPQLAHRRRWAAAVLLAALVVPGMVAIHANIGHLVMLGELLDDIAAAGASVDPGGEGAPLLFVNLPSWIAHRMPPYPIGFWGTLMLVGGFFNSAEIVEVTNYRQIETRDVPYPEITEDMPYDYDVRLDTHTAPLNRSEMAQAVREAGMVYLTQYEPDRVYLRRVGRVRSGRLPKPEPVMRFTSGFELLSVGPVPAGEQTAVRLVWALPEGVRPVEVHISLYGAAGEPLASMDGSFLGGLYPADLARPGDRIEDWRYFDVLPPCGGCEIEIELGEGGAVRIPLEDLP